MRARTATFFGLFLIAACSASKAPPPVAETPMGIASAVPVGTLPSITTPGPVLTDADVEETRRIRKTLKKVCAARGLEATRDIPGKVLGRDELIARVKAHVAKEVPPSALVDEGLVDQLLGLLPAPFDYAGEMFRLLEAQLAGYYEPGDGTMYMAADLDDDMAFATLAHELVHALQDQHWDLKSKSKYTPGRADAQLAQSCLAEGDATSSMLDVMLADSGKTAMDVPEAMLNSQMLLGMDTTTGANSPHFMRTSLIAPYVEGLRFVHARRRQGGWGSVNASWDRVPTTTEQILHPEKWEQNEGALDVAAPTYAALGAGWATAETDSFGELALRLVLDEWMSQTAALQASGHWGGDRAVLVRNGDSAALVWHLRYDEAKGDPKGATRWGKEGWAALAAGFASSHSPTTEKDASFVCTARPDRGPLAIRVKDREVVLVAGPAKVSATAPWSSAGDCALAKKLAGESLK